MTDSTPATAAQRKWALRMRLPELAERMRRLRAQCSCDSAPAQWCPIHQRRQNRGR